MWQKVICVGLELPVVEGFCMGTRAVLICALAVLLAGCGEDGSGDQAPVELSGVLQAGGVQGVHYETPTGSGVTDPAGTFHYLEGESVAFSVGGITLGSAPGAARVTLFTLVGMTPPTTEPALRRELDRASRTTSNFVRAANMMRLLMALDADHDPANGLDLRGRDSALATASLDFNQTIPQFAEALEKLVPDLTHNMPRWLPIVRLYRALGISVPAHAPVSHEFDYYGTFRFGTALSYFPDGSLESRGSHDNSVPANTSHNIYGYDELGRTTSIRAERHEVVWGSYFSTRETTFDPLGSLVNISIVSDLGADGTIDVSEFAEFDTDAFANILGQVTRRDVGHDGIVDEIDVLTAHFDARLNPVHRSWETDLGVDGVIDSRTTYDVVFDAGNRVSAYTYETDDPADGVADSRNTVSLTYDANGRGTLESHEQDSNGDGVVDSRGLYDWRYDSSGALRALSIRFEYDFDGNGAADSRRLEEATFDQDRRLLTSLVWDDFEADGITDQVSSRTRSYDSYGNVLEEVSETGDGSGSEWVWRTVTRYDYGAGAEPLGYETSQQFHSDGTPNVAESLRTTNILMDNGVLALAQSYLEFSLIAAGAVAAF
jgi:hypothetical protein